MDDLIEKFVKEVQTAKIDGLSKELENNKLSNSEKQKLYGRSISFLLLMRFIDKKIDTRQFFNFKKYLSFILPIPDFCLEFSNPKFSKFNEIFSQLVDKYYKENPHLTVYLPQNYQDEQKSVYAGSTKLDYRILIDQNETINFEFDNILFLNEEIKSKSFFVRIRGIQFYWIIIKDQFYEYTNKNGSKLLVNLSSYSIRQIISYALIFKRLHLYCLFWNSMYKKNTSIANINDLLNQVKEISRTLKLDEKYVLKSLVFDCVENYQDLDILNELISAKYYNLLDRTNSKYRIFDTNDEVVLKRMRCLNTKYIKRDKIEI